ncbi:transcriptional regulator [Streptomyces bullii]|uniref:Transcriptional regulator n=1 Tax=Streptomyces bullii TaxID=349910 RepID=A0ABW0UJ31_9ACTN
MLELKACLMYALGEAARRRLSEALTARGMRLRHLTTLALLAGLGPQPKTVLAARLDLEVSAGQDRQGPAKAGHVVCAPDTEDHRRVYVRLTPDGRSALDHPAADVTAADEDLLAPLSGPERDQPASLLPRLHADLGAS